MPEWRNWQTRQLQELVLAREWRFESSFGHQNHRSFPIFYSIPFRECRSAATVGGKISKRETDIAQLHLAVANGPDQPTALYAFDANKLGHRGAVEVYGLLK